MLCMLQHRTIRYFSACCLQMRADFKFFLVVIAVFFGSNSQRINIDIPSCPSVFIPKRLWFFRRFYWQNVFPRWPPFQFPDQRVKGIMRTSEEIDFRFRLKLKITLVESTYPSQRPECPSLSPHFLLVRCWKQQKEGRWREIFCWKRKFGGVHAFAEWESF